MAHTQRSMPVQLLRLIVDVWYTLSKISNSESYIRTILQGVEFLISQEDPSIRRKAVELVVGIVHDVKSSDATYDVLGSIVMPLLKRLAESEWFADAVSACTLIPLVYSDASESDQNEMRQCYKQLWESNLTIVRLEVARNLEKLLTIMHMDDSVSMFWLVLKNMSVDHLDQVRAHCVDACLSFARRCTPEQNLSFSYPVILAAAADSSWYVRKTLAERFDKICEIFGEDQLKQHLLDTHFNLLTDFEETVKNAAVTAFGKWCHVLSQPLAERYIALLESQLEDATSQIRQDICNIYATFAEKMNRPNVRMLLSHNVQRLLRDDSMDVRLCVLKNVEVLCDAEDFDKNIGTQIKETVDRALQTTRWRHRLVLAEKIVGFYNHFGFSIFRKYFSHALIRLLLDNVWKVRNTMLGSIEVIFKDWKGSWFADVFLTDLIRLYVEPHESRHISSEDLPLSYALKITVIQALVAVAKSLDVHTTLTRIVPVFLKATKDNIANVRFVAAKAIRSLFVIYKNERPEPFLRLRCRRQKTMHRVEPYRICTVGPKGVRQASSMATSAAATESKGSSSGMTFNKKFGQHMLKNPGILDKIVLAAEIRASDTVLEIGPGTGNLTVRIVPLARRVIAIDIDNRMVGEVKKRCLSMGYNNLEVIEGDALRIAYPKFDVCTANLPYQISSPFVFKLLSHRPLFRCAVLMFQKEFAERLLASTNEEKYGRLAINTRLFCTVTRVCKVAPGSFNPPPKVDSMIVKIVPREHPLVVDFVEWDGMIRMCFSRKRRTLRSLFKKQAVLSILEGNYKNWCTINRKAPEPVPFKDYCMGILEESGLSNRRSITISIAEFLELMLKFNNAGIHFANVARPSDAAPDSASLSHGGGDSVPEFLFNDDHMELDD
ncbi:putative dimethyladenosine transferase [Babesia sp. Xinjiang]|uniref:putative dimethyladenosine transferase n=1 Tax=Babesia sp. Xinjiang TaxID=462227 RepID=UPI000A22DA80|nr:putative dimethyladenosine transferase [Babesia sp. Xinjiang]ORM41513.1 putative dimethyladenosine transferase [Babesia sp. Xinjiang]